MATTRSYCRFCGALCGVLVDTDGHQVLSVRGDPDHPLSRGYTCPKGRALPAFHHHPDRLDQPLLDGKPASWSEVLGDLTVRIAEIIAAHGPDAVACRHRFGLRRERETPGRAFHADPLLPEPVLDGHRRQRV